MMKKTVVFACAILVLSLSAWAGAKSYAVTLYDPASAGGAQLKAGEYKVTVDNDKATITNGKISTESPVKVESAEAKYPTTSVIVLKNDGKSRISEIHLGGTKTKLVFVEPQAQAAEGQQ